MNNQGGVTRRFGNLGFTKIGAIITLGWSLSALSNPPEHLGISQTLFDFQIAWSHIPSLEVLSCIVSYK